MTTKRHSPALAHCILAMPLMVFPALAATAALSAAPAMSAERPLAESPLPVIRVSGEGKVTLAPDLAVIDLGVVREADTAREALDANNAAMADIVAAMKDEGIEARDLQTSGFFIQPKYVYPQSKSDGQQEAPRIVGYSVQNRLSVRIRDLARLGAVLDRSVTLGVNDSGSIVFGNDDPAAAIIKAREAAMKDAQSRAVTLTSAIGAKPGKILEISENTFTPQPVSMARGKMMMEARSDAVPIESGENTYTVTVQATWEIAQ
ncbi:MAG: SIMPL domain-containing protein [Nitratireductor sp.]